LQRTLAKLSSSGADTVLFYPELIITETPSLAILAVGMCSFVRVEEELAHMDKRSILQDKGYTGS